MKKIFKYYIFSIIILFIFTLYSCTKTYNLNNGTKVKETHMILIAGDIYLYEKIQIKGNQQGECEILGGGIVNED